MPGRLARLGAGPRRAAAVVLLLAVAGAGLRASGAFPAGRDPGLLAVGGRVLYWASVVIVAVLLAVELAVVVAWFVWGRRDGSQLPLRRRARNPLWWLVLAVEIIALARIAAALRHRLPSSAAQAAAARHARAAAGHLPGLPAGSWPVLATLAVAAALAGLLVLSARHTSPAGLPPAAAAAPPSPLRAALAAGAAELRGQRDPRAAIVACYAAMERRLADAGAPPAAADTPAEVLARAAVSGLLRSPAAATLTSLFRRARYSSEVISGPDLAAARAALSRLRAELGDRA
jgi:hypothetical protein